jgi:DnaK suppressor protein
MNATVTKSAKKSVARKPVPSAKAKPTGKTGGKSSLKTVAGKLVKKLAGALKSASKTTKAAAKPAAKPVKKAVKTGAKTASKVVKKAAPKPAAKSAAKPVAKSTAAKKAPGKLPAVKAAPRVSVSAPKPATKPVAKLAEKLTEKPAEKPAPAAPVKVTAAVVKMAPVASPEINHRGNQSGLGMSSNKAPAGLADKLENTVVSKVSEVATKTMKSTPIVTDGTLLSEAQILKMSDKDYMNAAQLAFFKARLQQLERDLLRNAGETTEHLRETVLVPDPADRATIEEEHALELRTRDRERKLLKKVQQSIASIDSGDYGWCEETGEPIGIPRLLARPTATLSLEAQQRRELKQKLYGD